jgi:hypothetical protein
MTIEEAAKLLESLKAEGVSDEDGAKLLLEAVEADTRGLIAKRDELLKAHVDNKAEKEKLNTKIAELETKAKEMTAQLEKNNPEEYKKYYEVQAKELETKYSAEIQTVSAERDKYKESHYTRLRDDALANGLKDIQFIDGLKDGFVALALTRNQFKPSEIDGKVIFTNQENKTIEAVLHELSLSKEGKAYIKNANAGGGGGGSGAGSQNPTNSMTREAFETLSPTQKMDFVTKGGIIAA